MKITALEEYGLRCMLALAQRGPEAPLTLPEFKSQEGLSVPYAAKLLTILKRAGLVKAVRGCNGGYVLAKKPEKIDLKEVLGALGEPAFSPAHCGRHTGLYKVCVHVPDCKVRDIWKSLDSFIGFLLDRITLADVVRGELGVLDRVSISIRDGNDSKGDRIVSSRP